MTMSTNDEIAPSLTRLYEFFIKIGYIKEQETKCPPHNHYDFNLELAKSSGLSDTSIELLKKIPWASVFNKDMLYESKIVDYSDEYSFEACRYPYMPNYDADEDNPVIDSNMLPLSIGTPLWGCIILPGTDNAYDETKAALFEYGWPDNFRAREFDGNIDNLWERLAQEQRNKDAEFQAFMESQSRVMLGHVGIGDSASEHEAKAAAQAILSD